jgi:hypothetical protein
MSEAGSALAGSVPTESAQRKKKPSTGMDMSITIMVGIMSFYTS